MDNVYLTGPLGTQFNIGSWIDKTADIDYGAAGLIRSELAQNPYVEGARLSYETTAGPRRFTFPLIVPSGGVGGGAGGGTVFTGLYGDGDYGAGTYGFGGGATGGGGGGGGLSLDAIEACLRQMVRPGGYIDIQPANVPTGEMVRFDILGGDLAHRKYDVDIQRISRRRFTLTLDTQPFGYWPTWITLASVASMALTGGGRLAITAPTMMGDYAALLELNVTATAPSQMIASAVFLPDGLVWSNGGRPSFIAGLSGGSWAQSAYTVTVQGDTTTPRGIASQRTFFNMPPSGPTWQMVLTYAIPSALEPAYRGRYRTFLEVYDDQGRPNGWLVDAIPNPSFGISNAVVAMASANTVATMAATSGGGVFQLLDLGELTLPAIASGVQRDQLIRLWVNQASGASSVLYNLGAYLLPLDGQAGILARGLAQPTIGLPATTSLYSLGGFGIRSDTGALAYGGSVAQADLTRHYRGVMPLYGATVQQIDLLRLDRRLGAASSFPDTGAVNAVWGSVSARYRPRFQFLKGL